MDSTRHTVDTGLLGQRAGTVRSLPAVGVLMLLCGVSAPASPMLTSSPADTVAHRAGSSGYLNASGDAISAAALLWRLRKGEDQESGINFAGRQ